MKYSHSTLRKIAKIRRIILRERLSPKRIAFGWALGMFVGCAIPFGLQLIVSVPLAIFFKISKVGATVATFITNPVTIFFIYPAQTYFANSIFFERSISYGELSKMQWTFESLMQLGAEVVASFFIGGFILAFILSPIVYFIVKGIVERFRNRRSAHKLARDIAKAYAGNAPHDFA